MEKLGLPRPALQTTDATLVYHAWLKWGQRTPQHLFGDWSFAVWDPKSRQLFLARDHTGNTALYYHTTPTAIAFSWSRHMLLRLRLSPVELDELYLAQIIISAGTSLGERSIHKPIRRLPPAHCLTFREGRTDVRRYWRLEDTPELRLPRQDYVHALLDIFQMAVRDRLPESGLTGATLSGGLDSGAVTVTAARCLGEKELRLSAFTSAPKFDTEPYVRKRFGDELPLARATAGSAANVDLTIVDAAGVCPIGSIRRALQIALEPKHGAGSMFWILELRRLAAEMGCTVLLTGNRGNEGISWAGNFSLQPTRVRLRALGLRRWLSQGLRIYTPSRIRRSVRRRRLARRDFRQTAIHPAFATRLDLMSIYLDEMDARHAHGVDLWLGQRFMGYAPSLYFGGASQAELGAAIGIDTRDPTGDARVLSFCFSVPDRVFIDPATGRDRWLIREAMQGQLPDFVRLNRRLGQQSADLVPRLRLVAPAVDEAIAEIEGGRGADYVSVAALRAAWGRVRVEDTPESLALAISVVTRGIMAGLFVNGFGSEW